MVMDSCLKPTLSLVLSVANQVAVFVVESYYMYTDKKYTDIQGTRSRKESLMPPIPSARNSPSFRKTSSSRGNDGLLSLSGRDLDQNNNDMNGLKVSGETGYLAINSGKKSTAEKLSDTGFQLYTSKDSSKLPKILKPKKKVSKGSKRKKTNAINDESQESDVNARLGAIQDNEGTSGELSTGKDGGELYNKYGMDLKRDFSKLLNFCNFCPKSKSSVLKSGPKATIMIINKGKLGRKLGEREPHRSGQFHLSYLPEIFIP